MARSSRGLSRTSPRKNRNLPEEKVGLAAMSDCLSSSREKMMTFSGSNRRRISRQHCFPNDPVPPVIKMVLPFSIRMGRELNLRNLENL